MKNLRTKVLSAVLAVSVLGASAVAFTGCGNKDTTNDSKVTLTNVSYDPTRELYESYNKIFAKHWKEETGQDVEVTQSHGGSGKQALEVAKVFDTDRTIVSYDNLGIARLIYQLPTTLCEMFLKEVFKRGSIESLDQETLFTIQRFFENNLNVSETSRKLFVHRNTLVYRLEKIKKLTGLDLREFEDAIVFKVALMVKKYLNASPTKY